MSVDSLRILIVDDDFDTRVVLSDVLQLDGYLVESAGSVKDTLARDDLEEYAAIILDRRLPDGNADELIPQLRNLAPGAFIIIATGHADLENAISALRDGVAEYIVKPINPELLRATLVRLTQLREAKRRACQAERLAAVGQMVSAVAHESRNALQRIQARTELMRLSLADADAGLGPGCDLPELLADLDAIQDANQGLRSLFDELRDYSAPIVLDKAETDLLGPIERAWENLRVLPGHDEASLHIKSRGSLDVVCCIDALRIEQVFRNLFENAIAVSPPPAEITVHLSDLHHGEREAIRISIRDNGPGFTAGQCRRAFEPFFTTKNAGTGLGLAISKRIVDAHNGRITISPSPATPAGAEVVVMLPIACAGNGQH